MNAPALTGDVERQLATIAYDLGELVRLQRDVVRAVHSIAELLDERIEKPVPPADWELWVARQDPDKYGGHDDMFWGLRALGAYYGYPECCVEAFVADARENFRPDRERVNHPLRGYIMCDECAADSGRANRLATEGLDRRIAPMHNDDVCDECSTREAPGS